MSTTDLAQQVADLTTATTKLTEEVVGQKDRLTAAADTATSKASEASGSAIAAEQSNVEAATEADQAKIEADRAKTEADRASEITGLDTVEEAVDMALSEYAGVMSAAQRQAIIDANEEKYAASGFVHYGKHRNASSYTKVNEGLSTNQSSSSHANKLYMGADVVSSTSGTSKTNFAVSHIAGAVSQLVNSDLTNKFDIKLPDAPDGTVIYDSTGDARGTGNANLNLRTETDPKYNDIASTDSEAVARAFEGQCKNGDFRLGDNGDWLNVSSYATQVFSNGICAVTGVTSSIGGVQALRYAVTPDTAYVVEFTVVSGTVGRVRRTVVENSHNPSNEVLGKELGVGTHSLRYTSPSAQTTNAIWFEAGGSLHDFSISNVSVKPVTEEVVTDRVDMFGLEQFDMVMKDDEIFDMVQSQSATFGDTDVPTVDSVRPDSFFAVYDGQAGISKGKCVKWSTLTDVQKRKVAAYMKERLWINENGNLTFTTIRQRSFAGAGNGDWYQLQPTASGSGYGIKLNFAASNNASVAQQGDKDEPVGGSSIGTTSTNFYSPSASIDLLHKEQQGCFVSRYDNTAYKGRCFFYVLGTCSRLNSGAYVKGLNESGANRVNGADGYGKLWHFGDANPINAKAQCFHKATSNSESGLPFQGSYGSIGSLSGRDDDRFYDAIYADGLGGVVDYRLPAYESDSPEEAAKVWEKVKNGTYRGLERLPFTSNILDTVVSNSRDNSYFLIDVGDNTESKYSWITATSSTSPTLAHGNVIINGVVRKVTGASKSGGAILVLNTVEVFGSSTGDTVQGCFGYYTDTSVSGNFTMTDVIGDPANILLTDALKGGWQGSWIPAIPDGTVSSFPLTRKSLHSGDYVTGVQLTIDNGVTWSDQTNNANSSKVNSTTNEMYGISGAYYPVGTIRILSYPAFAKQTKPSTNKPVYNGKAGLMDVFSTQAALAELGGLFAESLIGKVMKGTQTKSIEILGVPWGFRLKYPNMDKLEDNGNYNPIHNPVTLAEPTNNSPAVKVLPYQISNNGQGSIGYQANELTWDSAAGNWGDDNAIKITADGSDTFVDLNGNTNLSVVHELAIPYTRTSNHARAGEQVDGVDL